MALTISSMLSAVSLGCAVIDAAVMAIAIPVISVLFFIDVIGILVIIVIVVVVYCLQNYDISVIFANFR